MIGVLAVGLLMRKFVPSLRTLGILGVLLRSMDSPEVQLPPDYGISVAILRLRWLFLCDGSKV